MLGSKNLQLHQHTLSMYCIVRRHNMVQYGAVSVTVMQLHQHILNICCIVRHYCTILQEHTLNATA